MTKDYFRSTAHQGEQALAQIMQKQNRIEYLRDSDAKCSKHHEIKCTNCGTSGHNERSCVSECKHYEFVPFKNYLIIIDGRKYPHCEKENCLVRSPVRTKSRLRKLENLLPAGDLLPAGG